MTVEMPAARTLGGLIAELAERHPHRVAVQFGSEQTTFAELDGIADEIAAALLADGIRRGDTVAILAPNRPEWLYVAVGAARIGAMLAPLNTWYKDAELTYGLRHSEAKVLFSVDRVRNQDIHEAVGRIRGELPDLRTVVEFGPRLHRDSYDYRDFLARGRDGTEHVAEHAAAVRADDPLFLLYTSGSTARPKGVQLLHGHCIENGYYIGSRQGLTPDDRTWMVQPLFWALASMNMLFTGWTHASRMVLQETFDAGEALRIIERDEITRTYAIGNIAQGLVDHPGFAATDLSTLRKGVALFSPQARRLAYHDLGMDMFVSVYGSTETHAVCFSASWDDDLELRLADNGPLLDGWEARLVTPGTDETLPAGPGQGEVAVRGRLCPGYYKDHEQTADAFDSDGWFHTGDIVDIDARGRLEFSSRFKEMIKTGGINVAPAEVEETLSLHPDVKRAFVVGVPDPVKGEVVVAVVEANTGGVSEDAVRAWVAERLASYKVPAHVLSCTEDAIPTLATGKVPKQGIRELALRELSEDGS